MKKLTLEDINNWDLDLDKVAKWKEKEEYNRWKDDNRFNIFLSDILDYLSHYDYIESDDCLEIKELSTLMDSLFRCVNDYAIKYGIRDGFSAMINCDEYNHSSYCLKINGNFYEIEQIIGQGSFIRMSRIESNNGYMYVNYDKMMKSIK